MHFDGFFASARMFSSRFGNPHRVLLGFRLNASVQNVNFRQPSSRITGFVCEGLLKATWRLCCFLRGILHLGLHVLFRIWEPYVTRKCLFCLVKSLNGLPVSLPSSCISGLGGMTDFGPLYYFSGFLLIARL